VASQGPQYGGTIVDDSSVGTVVWSNPSYAGPSDNQYATASIAAKAGTLYSHYLKCTNFGFTIPVGATINGVVVTVERKASVSANANYAIDYVLKITNGVTTGTNKANTGTKWPTTEGTASYGSSTDLWGLSLTYSDVNNSGFGVLLQIKLYSATSNGAAVTAYVDSIQVTVYYTASTTYKQSLTIAVTSVLNLKTRISKIVSISEVASPVITVGKLFRKSLSLFSGSSALIFSLKTLSKNLSSTLVSLINLSKAKTFYRTLSVLSNTVSSFVRKIFKSVSVSSISTASIQKGKMFSKSLSLFSTATSTLKSSVRKIIPLITYGISSLKLGLTLGRSLSVREVSNVLLAHIKTAYKTLSVISSSILSILKGFTLKRSLLSTSPANSTLTSRKTFSEFLSAVSYSVLSLIKRLDFKKSFSVSSLPQPFLAPRATFYRAISVIEGSIVSLFKRLYFKRSLFASVISFSVLAKRISKSLLVVENSLLTLFRRIEKRISLSVISFSGAVLNSVKTFHRTIQSLSLSVSNLIKLRTFYRSLSVVSSVSVSLKSFIKKVLSIVSNTLPALTKKIGNLLSVPVTSVLELIPRLITVGFTQVLLSVQNVSSVSLNLVKTLYRVLLSTVVSVSNIKKSIGKRIGVISYSAVNFSKRIFKTFFLSVISLSSLKASKTLKVVFFLASLSISRLLKSFSKEISTISLSWASIYPKLSKNLSAVSFSMAQIETRLGIYLQAFANSFASFRKTISKVIFYVSSAIPVFDPGGVTKIYLSVISAGKVLINRIRFVISGIVLLKLRVNTFTSKLKVRK